MRDVDGNKGNMNRKCVFLRRECGKTAVGT